MNTPFDPTDPLLQSFADEAADLPLRAAVEARKTRALRAKRRRQLSLALAVLLCGVGAWQIFPRWEKRREFMAVQAPLVAFAAIPAQSATPSPQPSDHLIVRTVEQAQNEPLPLPEGLSEDQRGVVEAARGLPLVLVRDSSGKVTRIHVIE